MNPNVSLIHQIRLDARHGGPPMSDQELREFSRRTFVDPSEVRTAEREGRELRASGARCNCVRCQPDPLNDRERIRHNYAERRREEIEASGITDPAKRERIIKAELSAGGAFQDAPVTITRTTKGRS